MLGQIGAQWSCFFCLQDGVLAAVDRHRNSQKLEDRFWYKFCCVSCGASDWLAEKLDTRTELNQTHSFLVSKFLLEVMAVSRVLLRSGSIVSTARLSSACACHSWSAVNLKFLADVVSKSSQEITVAKKVRETVQLVVASWINRVAHEIVFSLCMSRLEGGHPECSC